MPGRKKNNPFELNIPDFAEYSKLFSYVPHRKQLEFHQLPQRIRVFSGGNRSGKTTAALYDFIYAALGIHPWQDWPPPPLRLRVVGPDFNVVINEIHLPRFREILPEGSYVWHAEMRTLELFNGSTINFRSYDQDVSKFSGSSLHGVWFDEEPPQRIYNENLMRVLDTGGKILMTFTPLSGINWLYDLVFSDKKDPLTGEPLVGVVFVSTYDNPYIKESDIEAVKALCRDEDEIAARFEGKFFTRSGLVYKEFDPRIHVVDPFPIPDDWMICISIDHHTRNPQAVVFTAIDPDDNVWQYDEFYEPTLVPEVCKAIKEKTMGRKISIALIDVNAATPDAVTGRSAKNEYWQNGIYVQPAKKGKHSVLEGIGVVREYLANQKLKIFRCCQNTIRQIEMYRWAEWTHRLRDKRDPKEVPLKKESHLLDALRYLVHMRPKYRPPALTSVRPPRYEPLFRKTGY
ncbi:hypothetical protein DRP04_00900 [Archaeoglobales archaeon]|nr:MAG: hypothetical protein DRP04_00900 [Archaeoglobales archaeon]